MMMKYSYLSQYPSVFLKMTGLTVTEFDELVRIVRPVYEEAEVQRLSQRERQREMGAGDAPT